MKDTTVADQMITIGNKLGYKCKTCEATAQSGSDELREWERAYLHFSDGDIDVLLCPKCKSKSPTALLVAFGGDA